LTYIKFLNILNGYLNKITDSTVEIAYNTYKLITNLQCTDSLDDNFYIISYENPVTHENTEVHIYIYTTSAKRALTDVESSINNGEFKIARKQISNYIKNGINIVDWSILEARMARMELLIEE